MNVISKLSMYIVVVGMMPLIVSATQERGSQIHWKTIAKGDYKFKVGMANQKNITSSMAWGQDSDSKISEVILSLVASYKKNEEILIPRSAYADLYNPVSFEVIRASGGCKLVIEGGDAGGAYQAIIRVEQDSVVSREVRDGEMPEEFLREKTTYYSK